MCDVTAFDAPLSEPRRAAFRAVVNIIRRTRRRGCSVSIYMIYMAKPWLSWRELRTNNRQPPSLMHSLISLPNNVRFTAASTVRRVLCAPPMLSITQNFGLMFRHRPYVCNSAHKRGRAPSAVYSTAGWCIRVKRDISLRNSNHGHARRNKHIFNVN
jgi:hypothetical protein